MTRAAMGSSLLLTLVGTSVLLEAFLVSLFAAERVKQRLDPFFLLKALIRFSG